MNAAVINKVLKYFFSKSQDDNRLDKSHMAVYLALLNQWQAKNCNYPFEIFAKTNAKFARVSLATYYQCVRDLNDFGYLKYEPSYMSCTGSRVYFNSF